MLKKTRNHNFVLLALICAGCFVYAWENVQAYRLGYSIERVRKEIKDLESANTYLRKEIQTSLSPERLEAEALKMGMIYPEPGALVMLDGPAGRANPAREWLARLPW
jgi:cell division protein FtsL